MFVKRNFEVFEFLTAGRATTLRRVPSLQNETHAGALACALLMFGCVYFMNIIFFIIEYFPAVR